MFVDIINGIVDISIRHSRVQEVPLISPSAVSDTNEILIFIVDQLFLKRAQMGICALILLKKQREKDNYCLLFVVINK